LARRSRGLGDVYKRQEQKPPLFLGAGELVTKTREDIVKVSMAISNYKSAFLV
jgi:hypothetical protein